MLSYISPGFTPESSTESDSAYESTTRKLTVRTGHPAVIRTRSKSESFANRTDEQTDQSMRRDSEDHEIGPGFLAKLMSIIRRG